MNLRQHLHSHSSPLRWNSVQITLMSTSTPALLILSSYFITDDNTVAIIEPSPHGQLIVHSPGQVQCKSKDKASLFSNCSFAKHACSCTPRVYTVKCTCSNGTISPFLQNESRRLPVTTSQVAIINEEGSVIKAKTTISSALIMQISAQGLVMANRNNNSCLVKMEELFGFYSCTQGATTKVSCKSSASQEAAQIQCGNSIKLVICTPDGHDLQSLSTSAHQASISIVRSDALEELQQQLFKGI
ncbi:unnamed protein product [Haemonchus placei]|uniref:Phlebovirus_G2 domain-containing protein n=1 Tax=Haemonchus placei TaxID=6290 RepID=A0A0N4W775_HAEPC|nr:unnamed protein product [Haemonchus placei]